MPLPNYVEQIVITEGPGGFRISCHMTKEGVVYNERKLTRKELLTQFNQLLFRLVVVGDDL